MYQEVLAWVKKRLVSSCIKTVVRRIMHLEELNSLMRL